MIVKLLFIGHKEPVEWNVKEKRQKIDLDVIIYHAKNTSQMRSHYVTITKKVLKHRVTCK
jgi:hypothetical protein